MKVVDVVEHYETQNTVRQIFDLTIFGRFMNENVPNKAVFPLFEGKTRCPSAQIDISSDRLENRLKSYSMQ